MKDLRSEISVWNFVPFLEQTIRPGAQGPGEQTGAEIHRQTV